MAVLQLSSPQQIHAAVDQRRCSRGAPPPRDLATRLGASHVAGRYRLTDKPFLLEGAQAIHRLGMGVLKLWLNDVPRAYPFNSQWNLPRGARLAQVVSHDHFQRALEVPFDTVAFEIQPCGADLRPRGGKARDEKDFSADTEQMEELALHLLKSAGRQKRTFILQHWEGDWMLRGADKDRWKNKDIPADAHARCQTFAAWLRARQKGVENARARFGPSPATVLHAAEVNRVLDCLLDVPTVVKDVLPLAAVDLVSWSAYDGTNARDPAVATWQGLEIIRHFALPSPAGLKNHVFVGEVGIPENAHTPQRVREFWDTSLAVFFAQDLPWIIQWELYCNEPKANQPPLSAASENLKEQDLRGFWLIKPDGTFSTTARLFTDLLEMARRK